MLRLCTALALAMTACHPEGRKTTAPEPIVRASVGPDVHSFSQPQAVRVARVGLRLAVDFDARALAGTATFSLARHDRSAPLWLDTRALQIEAVEIADAEVGDRPLADLDADFAAASWQLAEPDAILGAGLRVELAPATTVVRVHYRTTPAATGLQWLTPAQTADGRAPFLYSQSQAIHARSWFPSQDSPGVRTPWDAVVTAPVPLRALMSADALARDEHSGAHRFAMAQGVPAYLVALAVGALEFRELGPRTGVWAEPSMLPAAADEFADMERMLAAVETLYGPYRWGRYDLLVLPPSFPFGGMENPKLTFATPTIIAGDRSLVSLVAHELAHSWSGNLVTNATWADLWLNEGFTVYIERRIVEALFGRERAEMESVLGHGDLEEAFGELSPDDQRLRVELGGRDPDEGLSDVAYEKGALLLVALEQAYGRETFDPFLQQWFESHAFGSVTTAEFVEFAQRELFARHQPLAGRAPVSLDAWLDHPGLPPDATLPHSGAFDRIDTLAAGYAAGTTTGDALLPSSWTPQQWLRFLRGLPRDVSHDRLVALERSFALSRSGNAEILAQWLELCVRHGVREADEALEGFLRHVGRRKFVMPLYRALLEADRAADAQRIYGLARAGYHPITQQSVDALLREGRPRAGAPS